ncbi:MAG TPA: amidohydrolase family protein [candidate division Zixibacteria bacterium]|jgi:predicted TIM-barrel fold metal-dependent hydrolase
MEVIDTHTHFLSYNYFRLLTQHRETFGDVDGFIRAQGRKHEFVVPDQDPVRLADRWVIELDSHKVARAVLISGMPGDEASIKDAMRIYPDRFIGVMMVNPYLSIAEELVEHAAGEWGFRGIALYPSLHRFSASSSRIYPIYRIARRHQLAVFIHFGRLRIAAWQWWGLRETPDRSYADPADLHQAATDFPSINFIVPCFGAGTLSQLLRIGLQCPNVYVDTASSNSWLEDQSEFRDLAHVFEKALEVFGPGRILFGTDSGLFPRGWRASVFEAQLGAMRAVGVSERAIEAIVGQNARQVFGIDRRLPAFVH